MRAVPLFLVCCLLAITVLTAPGATVGMLDGRLLNGPSLRIDHDTLRIGGTTVALADCDWFEPGSGSGTALGKAALGVWLVDGGWLPASAIAAGSADHTLRVTSPLGAIDLPLTAVRGWSSTAELPGDERSDRVVLDGGPVAGRIDGIMGGKLQIRSDLSPDKALEFPFDQIRAVRLAVAEVPADGMYLAVVLDADRPALRLRPGATPTLIAAPAVVLAPWDDGPLVAARFRIEGGRRTYLSDLVPTDIHDEGAFGVVWPWQRDHNLDGTPLRLGGIRCTKGVVVHSKASLAWNLDGRFARLRAQAGIADVVGAEGDCAAIIAGDGKILWERSSVKGGEKPIVLDLDLSGVKRLELRVDLGARYDIGDHFTLADAWLVQSR